MKWIAAGFTLFIAFIVIEADRGQVPSFIKYLYAFPGGDLAGHFTLIGIMSFLADTAFASGKGADTSKIVIKVSIAIAVIVTVEELSQLFLANRTFSLLDLSFSYLGIIFFACPAYLFSRALG